MSVYSIRILILTITLVALIISSLYSGRNPDIYVAALFVISAIEAAMDATVKALKEET